jgi:ribosomal protein S20
VAVRQHMQRQDIELLNTSLDRLGDSLLRERMMKEQKSARADESAFRERQFGLDERRVSASESQASEAAEMKKMLMENQQSQQALANLQQAYQSIAKDYDSGVIDQPEANRRAKALVDKIKLGTDALLQASPFAAMLQSDGELFQAKSARPSATEVTIGGKRFAQTAQGALHPLDREPPRPFTRSSRDPDNPDTTITERLTADEYNQVRSKQQAKELQKEYDLLLAKYREGDRSGSQRMIEIKAALRKLSGEPTQTAAPSKFDSLLDEARKALARGASRDAVAKRFKELTGQDLE